MTGVLVDLSLQLLWCLYFLVCRHSLTVSVDGSDEDCTLSSHGSSRHRVFYCSQPVIYAGNKFRSPVSSAPYNSSTATGSSVFSYQVGPHDDINLPSSALQHRRSDQSVSLDAVGTCSSVVSSRRSSRASRSTSSSSSPSTTPTTPDFRRPTLVGDANGNENVSVVDLSTMSAAVSWVEQLCQRWLVKFRSRRRRRRSLSPPVARLRLRAITPQGAIADSRPTQSRSSSRRRRLTLEAQMKVQYALCRDVQLSAVERLFAMFYCWYFGRIEYVDGLLDLATDRVAAMSGCRRRESVTSRSSSIRLAFAVLFVTLFVLIIALTLVTMLKILLVGLALIVHSALNFTLLLVMLFLVTVATVTFASFDWTPVRRNSRGRSP